MNILEWNGRSLAIDDKAKATFGEWQRKASYKTEAKENGTSWPKTGNKGPELGTISFSVLLSRRFGINVRAELDKWIAACNSGKADALRVGGVRVGDNKWQLRSVEEKEMLFDAKIKPVQARMAVTFQEYYAGSSSSGSKKSSGKSSGKKNNSSSKKPKPIKDKDSSDDKKSDIDITQRYDQLYKQKNKNIKGLVIK